MNRLLTFSILASAAAQSVLAALTGGTLALDNSTAGAGGGSMEGGGYSMNFALGGASSGMTGGGFSLQPGAIGAAQAASANLDTAHAFPTAYKPSAGHDRITFGKLTSQVTISIYNLGGEKVKTLTKSDPLTDQLVWMPVANDAGTPLASGLYIYVVASPGHSIKRGKLMIIR